jgi:hypothetical protein
MFPRLLRRCLSAFPQYAPVCSLRTNETTLHARSLSLAGSLCVRAGERHYRRIWRNSRSFVRSLARLGGGCTPAKKPRSQYLSPCITVWPAFVAGAGAKIRIYCRRPESGPSERAIERARHAKATPSLRVRIYFYFICLFCPAHTHRKH